MPHAERPDVLVPKQSYYSKNPQLRIKLQGQIAERFFIYSEMFGINLVFFRYFFGAGAASPVGNVNDYGLSVSYDVMFGVGYKFGKDSQGYGQW
jgi:hypothetical protein